MSTELYCIVQDKIITDDIQSFKAHAKIMTMQELTYVEMLGPVTEEIDELFAKGGWTYNAYPLAMWELV